MAAMTNLLIYLNYYENNWSESSILVMASTYFFLVCYVTSVRCDDTQIHNKNDMYINIANLPNKWLHSNVFCNYEANIYRIFGCCLFNNSSSFLKLGKHIKMSNIFFVLIPGCF